MPQPLTLIVNVFKFFDRKDLEIVSTSAKHANRIVRKHFPSKPYRFLNDVTLEIYRYSGKFTDGLAVVLENHSTGYRALESMRPYLSQFVRFKETILVVEECLYTPEDMTILDSISHVWSGRSLWLCAEQLEDPINFPNNISDSLHNILTNDAIFSKTVFVVDISTFETRVAEVTDAIRKSFSSASTPCPFQLVIIDYDEDYNEEFRFENETTHEVLRLMNAEKDSLFVTKFCEHCDYEFEAGINEQIILIERSRV
ncbi:hypothetical protein Ddc_12720 [Ditylenchus destructor]|nr:hypothetical protein Ddc_12720 [Ditylenchus destructor]